MPLNHLTTMAKFFTINEFTRSATADARGIDNSLPAELTDAAKYTLSRLDDIRERYGYPIYITSGYRCQKLNKAVGGKPTSQHLRAEAADLRWDANLLKFILQRCQFDQLIEEKSGKTKWIHISFKRDGERNQYLRLQV